jgi:hypothetical protein
MELIKEHISNYLNSFVNEKSITLDKIESKIQDESMPKNRKLINFLDKFLNLTIFNQNNRFEGLHLHFENEFTESQKILIAEFLCIKLFEYHYISELNRIEENSTFIHFKASLKGKLKMLENKCPDGASGKNGGNKIWKNWLKAIRDNIILLDFYNNLNENSALKLKTIFNTQKNLLSPVLQKFEFRPYGVALGSSNKSYNLLNVNKSLNEIDAFSSSLIDELDSVVLFDCERKKIMTNFSYEVLNKWNNEFGTNFTRYLIVTFGKANSSLNETSNKLELIKERFKIPVNFNYIVTKSEIDFLLYRKEKSFISVNFTGFERSSFWEIFVLEASIRELYELRSIKLMNIFSFCYTDEIKNYIIDDLFSKRETSELISSTTKMAILELGEDDSDFLKDALSKTLDVIMNSDIKVKVLDSLSDNPTIVIDDSIFLNQNLLSKIMVCLGLATSTKIKTWADILNSDLKNILILSYRDQGRYPNYYFPNLLELEVDSKGNAKAVLPSFFFLNYFNWSKYNIYKEYHKLLTHPIRENHFEWVKLKNKIQELKPEQKLNIDWNLENEYSNSDQRESYKVKLKGQRLKTAYSSDLFVIKDDTKTLHKVVKIDYLLTLDNEDGKVFIQNLDEIQQNINIYDKIVDKKQQEAELEVIRKQFNLGDETAGRLWKVLLKNLAEDHGENQLYSDLKKYFETKGIKIVSKFHFKNSWMNPQSESIAPLSKKVFIELCEYLKIPKIYFIIIQRIRNASKQSSRQSTRQMNQLLKDLFNDGCFDTNKNARDIITNRLEYYKVNHPLDELGIDENYLADNLVTLVELILPELKLLELETIEKNHNE